MTDDERHAIGRATLYACYAGANFKNADAMSAMTMAAATLIDLIATEQGIDRGGLADNFYDGLVLCLKTIDDNKEKT